VDLETGVPFEGAGADVVVAWVVEDGGVGVEAGEDGVAEGWHCGSFDRWIFYFILGEENESGLGWVGNGCEVRCTLFLRGGELVG